MGILDDAIRQHLELKRQHGAGDDDLDRLEKEAFGPATRPGDPEFVDPDAPAAEEESAEQPIAEAPSEEMAVEPASEELAFEPASEEMAVEAPGEEILGAGDETPAERARIEHANLDDTADHPAPVQLGPADEAEPTPDEPAPSVEAAAAPAVEEPAAEEPAATEEPTSGEEPVEAPEGGIFNAEDFDFEDLDLELDSEEEPEAVDEAPPEAAPIIEPPSGSEPVVEAPAAPIEAEPEPIRESEPARQDAATDAPAPVEEPAAEPAPAEPAKGDGEATRRTCSRRRPTSSRRPRARTSGSSRGRRATSTSTTTEGRGFAAPAGFAASAGSSPAVPLGSVEVAAGAGRLDDALDRRLERCGAERLLLALGASVDLVERLAEDRSQLRVDLLLVPAEVLEVLHPLEVGGDDARRRSPSGRGRP